MRTPFPPTPRPPGCFLKVCDGGPRQRALPSGLPPKGRCPFGNPAKGLRPSRHPGGCSGTGMFLCGGHGAQRARRDAGAATQGFRACGRVRSLNRRGRGPLVSADSFGFLIVATGDESLTPQRALRSPFGNLRPLPDEGQGQCNWRYCYRLPSVTTGRGAKECRGRPQSPLPASADAAPSPPPQRQAAGSASRRACRAP